MDISVVIPVYNEVENLIPLYNSLNVVLDHLKLKREIIFVDDGSKDDSFKILAEIAKKDKNVRVVKFRRNFGQTAAMDAGFKLAEGKIVVSMDADLQNDPNDIPRLIEKLNQGFDVVTGWRFNRKDKFFTKKLPSKCANILRRILAGEKLHDVGCTLKIFRDYTLKDLRLFAEMHRFIPTILRFEGYNIGELKVKHNPRLHGITKYNSTRLLRGFFDLINVIFWYKYSKKPLHFFGKLSLLSFIFGLLIFIYNIFINYFVLHVPLHVGPLLLFSVMLVIASIQLFVLGLLAEMICRIYYSDANFEDKVDVILN